MSEEDWDLSEECFELGIGKKKPKPKDRRKPIPYGRGL